MTPCPLGNRIRLVTCKQVHDLELTITLPSVLAKAQVSHSIEYSSGTGPTGPGDTTQSDMSPRIRIT
jgi:hypothetical protein